MLLNFHFICFVVAHFSSKHLPLNLTKVEGVAFFGVFTIPVRAANPQPSTKVGTRSTK